MSCAFLRSASARGVLRIVLYIMTTCEMTFLLKTQVSLVWNERKKKSKDRQRSKTYKAALLVFFLRKKSTYGHSDDDEKESAPLEKKHSSLSLDVETNTPNGREKAAVFSRKDKKNHGYLAIKLTHVDTLNTHLNTHTHIMFSVTQSAVAQSVRLNVVSKRSVKVRWVVVALFLFFLCFSRVSFSFKRARAVKEKSRWMMFSTLDDEDDDEKCDWLSRARSLALS